jgi:hypothetical protein
MIDRTEACLPEGGAARAVPADGVWAPAEGSASGYEWAGCTARSRSFRAPKVDPSVARRRLCSRSFDAALPQESNSESWQIDVSEQALERGAADFPPDGGHSAVMTQDDNPQSRKRMRARRQTKTRGEASASPRAHTPRHRTTSDEVVHPIRLGRRRRVLLKPRSQSASARDGAYRIPSGGFSRSGRGVSHSQRRVHPLRTGLVAPPTHSKISPIHALSHLRTPAPSHCRQAISHRFRPFVFA